MSMEPRLRRWRLVLGAASQDALAGLSAEDLARDAALDWLYERDPSLDERDVRRGGDEASSLTVPEWISEVHRLFPKETIERLERDAVETYGLHEVVTRAEVLERIEPSETLLRAILLTRHLMNQEVLNLARAIVRKVVRELMERLKLEVRRAFSGARSPRRARVGTAADFDWRRTIQHNLKRRDPASGRVVIERPLFRSRSRKQRDRWQLVLLVDQSGSMVGSVIHAAVTAACLTGLPAFKTHLVAFDTEVVDLSAHMADPVETLMKVQLGGGTDIARAMRYAEGLIENPKKAIVACISDFFEGGDEDDLVLTVKRLTGQGVKVLGLPALDVEAIPSYDRDLARRLVRVGAEVGAMTPGQLVHFLTDVLA
jgi:Mg-chelatase subunit ChlD